MPLSIFENGRISKFMDHEYLQNVMGSPYVNEGGFDQLKAKAAQAMGAVGTMAGQPIQNPTETKLHSLWEGFMSSLKKVMADWKGVSDNSFDAKVQLDDKQQQVKEALDTLERFLSSAGPQKIGTFPQGEHDPRVRNQRDNPNTYVKGSAYNRSTTSPKKAQPFQTPPHDFGTYNTPTKLTEILGEGFWNRDVKLNKSLGSNDPSTILDSYKNHVLGIFKNFMKDARKMTGMTVQQIYGLLAKMQPAQSGWQAAGNMQKVVEQLKTLQSIGDIKGQGAPPVMNPQAAAGAVPPVIQQPPQQQPPPIPQQPPQQPQQQAPQQPTAPQAPSGNAQGDSGIQGGDGSVPPDQLPFVVLKAMKIVIDAVKSDKQHVGTFFSGGELPKDYGGATLYGKVGGPSAPSTTTETVSGPKPKGGTAGEEDFPEAPEKEVPGQFLYNFHSKHRKTPASSFSIQVKPVTEDPVIKELPGQPTVEVWWQNENHKNRIFAVVVTQGKKSKPIPIMLFHDNEVSSKGGATTPNDPNFFTAEKVLQASNPNADSPIAKASEQVKAQIKQLEPNLLRALMAVTGRKAMEFVPKSTKIFRMKYDEQGDVTTKDETFTKDQVKLILNPVTNDAKAVKAAEAWKETLDAYGYFDMFPDMKPSGDKPSDEGANVYQDAIKMLMSDFYQMDEKDATLKVQSAVVKFKEVGITLKDISTDELAKAAFTGKIPEKFMKPKEPAPAPAEEPETTSGATVSKPAGQPPPEAEPPTPVSGAAGGSPPSTPVTAPVSNDKPETDKGKEPAQQQQQSPEANPEEKPEANPKGHEKKFWLDADGDLKFTGKAGAEIPMSKAQALAMAKKYPKVKAALDASKIDLSKLKESRYELDEKAVNPFQVANLL